MTTVAASAFTGSPYFTTYDGTEQTGRVLAGLFDSVTVLLVFGVGLRLWGVAAALFAAALYAFAVLPISLGHMYISDPFMTTFMTAALLASVLYYQSQRPRWASAICIRPWHTARFAAFSTLSLGLFRSPGSGQRLPGSLGAPPSSSGIRWSSS